MFINKRLLKLKKKKKKRLTNVIILSRTNLSGWILFLCVIESMNNNVKLSVVSQLLESAAMLCLDSNYCECKVLTQDILTPPVLKWHV